MACGTEEYRLQESNEISSSTTLERQAKAMAPVSSRGTTEKGGLRPQGLEDVRCSKRLSLTEYPQDLKPRYLQRHTDVLV